MRANEFRWLTTDIELDLPNFLMEAELDLPDEVQFATTKLTDKHIKWIIKEVAKRVNVSEKEVENNILEKIKPIYDFKNKAPLLYSTIAENAIEGEVFRLVEEHGIEHEDAPKLSMRYFYMLVDYIKAQYSDFFPLRDIKTNRVLKETYIMVPDEVDDYPQYASVDTAAATRDGTFIFNTKFMQHLMNYATIKGVVPKSKKYKSNGGPIPDAYCYIEFLIIHEYMHYTQADWDLSKIYKVSGKISNWVGDFRNNYSLLEGGLEQLPIGLFSKDINLRKQRTFKQMVDIVTAEFENLKSEEQKQLEKILDDLMDDHEQQGNGDEGGEGSGDGDEKPGLKPGQIVQNKKTGKWGKVVSVEGDNVEIEEVDPPQKNESQLKEAVGDRDTWDIDDIIVPDQDGKDSGKGSGSGSEDGEGDEEDEGSGSGDGEGDEGGDDEGKGGDDRSQKEIDKQAKDIADKLRKGRKKDTSQKPPPSSGLSGQGGGKGGPTSSGSTKAQKLEWKFIPPKFNWRKMLDKIISNASGSPEETYAKVNRTSIATTAHTLQKIGKAVVKPGETPPETKLKVAICVDSSGSMSYVIQKVYAELEKLLKNYNRLDNNLVFVRFSDGFEQFSINIKKQQYHKISSPNDKTVANIKEGNLKELFSEHYGAGTNFSPELVSTLTQYTTLGYFVIVISDSDVLVGNNFDNLKSIMANSKSALILGSKEDYTQAIKQVGARSNITYFS